MPPEPGADIPHASETDSVTGDAGGAGGLMSRDDFFACLRAVFGAPNALLLAKGHDPLLSLQIHPGDDHARRASDCLYDTCLDVPWLRWLLSPDGTWAQRAMIIGGFAFAKFQVIRAEIDERKKPAPASANDGVVEVEPGDPAEPVPEDLATLEPEKAA